MTDVSARLAFFGSATLGECGAARMAPRIAAVWPGAHVAGPAYAIRCSPGDNLAVHVGVTSAPSGSVLCADMGAVHELGYWGEVLATAAVARGIAGLVIDGCVRDVGALRSRGFPVFATGIALTGASKNQPGDVGGRANVGGISVTTGDWIVGDIDGVVCAAASQIDDVLAAAAQRTATEAAMFERLDAGATTVELLSLDGSLINHHGNI